MKIVMFVLLFLSMGVSAAVPDKIDVKLSGGRYTLWADGVEQIGYRTQLYTAVAWAVNLGLNCDCKVVIKSFDIEVDVKRITVETDDPAGPTASTGSYEIHWDVPTHRVAIGDSEPVPLNPGDIFKYIIVHWQEGSEEIVVNVMSPRTALNVVDVPIGIWFVKGAAVDTYGQQSAWTETIEYDLKA